MKIYDEISGAEITAPDLEKGCIYAGQRVVRRVEEVKAVMQGGVTKFNPKGLRRLIPAHDEYESCQLYHTYTPAELEDMKKAAEPSLQDQIDANAAAITEIAMMMAGGGT